MKVPPRIRHHKRQSDNGRPFWNTHKDEATTGWLSRFRQNHVEEKGRPLSTSDVNTGAIPLQSMAQDDETSDVRVRTRSTKMTINTRIATSQQERHTTQTTINSSNTKRRVKRHNTMKTYTGDTSLPPYSSQKREADEKSVGMTRRAMVDESSNEAKSQHRHDMTNNCKTTSDAAKTVAMTRA